MIPTKLYGIIGSTLPMIVLFSLVMILYRMVCVIMTKEKINVLKELKMLIYTVYCFLLFRLVTTTDFESYSNNFIPLYIQNITNPIIPPITFKMISSISKLLPMCICITSIERDVINTMNVDMKILSLFVLS